MILEILVGILIIERIIWYWYFNDEVLRNLNTYYRNAILELKERIKKLENAGVGK